MKEAAENQKPQNLKIEIGFLILLALLWGSSYLLIKVAVETIPPITLIASRVSIAAVFLFAFMKFKNEKLPTDTLSWKRLFIQSFLNSIGAWTVLAWGQQYVDSGLASVLNSTSPIFVFLFTCVLAGQWSTNILKLIGASLGLIGVVLIVGADVLAGLGQQVLAQMAVLLGAVMYAGAAIYGKHFSHLPPIVTATATMIWASICLIPASFALEQPWLVQPTLKSIIATVILSIFCTGLALLIYFRLLKTLGSIGTASQAYLRAGVGVVLGIIFLGESITPAIAIGLTLAIAGVAVINFPSKRT